MRLLHPRTALRLRAALRPRSVVLTDEHGDLTAADLAGLVALAREHGAGSPGLRELPVDAPLRRVLVAALAGAGRVELLSSGSGGSPRYVRRGPLSPAQLRTLADLAHRIGLRAGRSIACAAPGVRGHGLQTALGALAIGARLVDLSHLPGPERIALLHRTSPYLLTGVPVHLADLLRADRALASHRPLRIARVVSGSDVLDPQLRADITRQWSARVHDVYGTNETGSLTVDGRPLRGVRIRARDGLLHARTPFTHGREIITDRGHVDERGLVHVTGRADGTVSSGGMLHDPRAVVRLLSQQPRVAAVQLRMVGDERFGRRTVAEVTLRSGPAGGEPPAAPDPEELRTLVRDRLGAASVPREVRLHRASGLSSRGG